MIFFLVYLFMFAGVAIMGMGMMMPAGLPESLNFMLFTVGVMVLATGIIILHSRALKTGVVHFLDFPRPERVIWLYAHRDGTIKIVPSQRTVEGQLYSPELDARIQDLKSYKIFDHQIRIVPEGIGHAVDLDFILYTTMLESKWGFENLKEARQGFFQNIGLLKPKDIIQQEQMEETQ